MATIKDLLPLVQKIEHKYGSVLQAPYDDNDFAELRKLTYTTEQDIQIKEAQIDPNISSRVKYLIEYGFTRYETSRMLKIEPYKVANVQKLFGLDTKPRFRYQIIKNDKLYYGTNLIKLYKQMQFPSLGASSTIYKYVSWLKKHDYDYKEIDWRWGDIPNGSYYVVSSHNIKQKYNIESYLK